MMDLSAYYASQKALSVNLGPESNVSDLSFAQDSLAPERVEAQVQDRLTGQTVGITLCGGNVDSAVFAETLLGR